MADKICFKLTDHISIVYTLLYSLCMRCKLHIRYIFVRFIRWRVGELESLGSAYCAAACEMARK